ncbi:MAG: membrane bound O-acyl transferase family-domain-containing protein [Pirellulales bacterium]
MKSIRAAGRSAVSFEPGDTALGLAILGGLLLVIVASPLYLPPWASMLANCAAVFLGLKHLIWTGSHRSTESATLADRMAFYVLWPGMDVDALLGKSFARLAKPYAGEWLHAVVKISVAAVAIWIMLPWSDGFSPAVIGMLGMLGAILLIHCGLFHCVALVWQSQGRNVRPIMNAPLLANSLADFWSRRWNLAFRDAAAQIVFRPAARRWGVTAATFATFLASGLIHDAAISLPARGGYGLPTLYFLLQFLGLMFERQVLWGHDHGTRVATRFLAAIVIVVPLPLLFHPPFAENVIVPMLEALHVFGVHGVRLP